MTLSNLYDSHLHTPFCIHAKGEPDAYARQAELRGLRGIVFTCHNPSAEDRWSPETRMRLDQFPEYVALVERTRQEWTGRLDVRLGLECDYYPGAESGLADLLGRADLDYVLGSVHPQLADYKARYLNGGDALAFQRTYFEHLAMAAESGLFDCLAHPDVIKMVFPQQWQPDQLIDDIRRALDRIAAAGMAMEMNTSGLQKAYPEMNPGRLILAEMHLRGIPVVLGSDAHGPERVGADFELALDWLREASFTHVHVFAAHRRQAVAIGEVTTGLRGAGCSIQTCVL